MNAPRFALVGLALTLIWVAGCGESASSAAETEGALVERIERLMPDVARLDRRCDAEVSRLAQASRQGAEAEADLAPCVDSLALAGPGDDGARLRRLAKYLPEEASLSLHLELAARTTNPDDLSEAGHQLLRASGFSTETNFEAADAETFWAARGAWRRSAHGGSETARREVQRLEDLETPVPVGIAHRDILRDLYFHRWPQDSVGVRRIVAGYAIGLRDACTQWETGVASVAFSRGLESLLAPVRAEIPGRLLNALPMMGRHALEAGQRALSAVPESGVSSALAQGLHGLASAKRDFDVALSVASASGRDAGIATYQTIGSCRSPRGLRLTDALVEAFDHYSPQASSTGSLEKEALR